MTVVDTVELLFCSRGSKIPPMTDASLTSVVPAASAATVAVIVACAEPPEASAPNRHVTPPAATAQVPWLAVVSITVTLAGSGSSMTTAGAVLGPSLVTSSVYVTLPPACTVAGFADLTIARSASGSTSTSAPLVLSRRSGSGWSLVTVAVLRTVCPAFGVCGRSVIVTSVLAPSARSPSAHATEAALASKVHLGSALTNTNPAGTASDTATADATFGPALATVSVYVMSWKTRTVGAAARLTMLRFASWATTIAAASVLFARAGSGVVLETVELLVTVVPAAARSMRVSTVSVRVAPAASAPLTQVITAPAAVQSDEETKVRPAGKVSVTRTSAAGLGPLFVTTMV